MTMWMVRAEVGGRLFQDFVSGNYVSIGWAEIGDPTTSSSYEELSLRFDEEWPEWKQQARRTSCSMVYRFVHQLSEDDYVVTYDPKNRVYAIGQCIGGFYFEDDDSSVSHRNRRRVEWIRVDFPRDKLGAATKNTLGSILTLFKINETAEAEILAKLQNDLPIDEVENEETESETLVDDMEARSAEFIKDKIVQLSWDEMQDLVAGLLRAMGYKTVVSPSGPDRGKDIVASPDGFGFEDPRIVVEVKHRSKTPMGSSQIRSFLGGRHPGDKGLYVSTGGFSKDAHYEAERANIPLTLMDLDYLAQAIMDSYEQMDTETQRLLPLKKIYWPM